MLNEFWKSVAGKLADRWAGIAVPAIIFWAGFSLMWALAEQSLDPLGVGATVLAGKPVTAQVMILLWVLVAVAASAVLVGRLTEPALRILQGYWPKPFNAWSEKRVAQFIQIREDEKNRWQELKRWDEHRKLSSGERAELTLLDERRSYRPALDIDMMPTRTGNILKAAETRSDHRYGLQSQVVWPRLWLLLPDSTRQETVAARGALDAAAAAVVWGVLFAVLVPATLVMPGYFAGWTWRYLWIGAASAALGITVSGISIRWWVPHRAETFGGLFSASFDLYRASLYEQLRWPLPSTPAEEPALGNEISRYLWRGSDQGVPRFTLRDGSTGSAPAPALPNSEAPR